MNSELPKVLHPIGGRPMVCAVIDACRQARCKRIVLVVGHGQEVLRQALAEERGIEYAVQDRQLGTGHAVRCTEALFAKEAAQEGKDVFVLAGDGPLIRGATLKRLRDRHRSTGAAATLATAVIDDPTGYGRIVRGADGRLAAIVEDRDCTPEQRRIREVNPSYYCFDARALFGALAGLTRNPKSGEYYITDVPAMLLRAGQRVEVIDAVPAEDVLSINTPEQLAEVDAIYRARASAPEPTGPASPAQPPPRAAAPGPSREAAR